MEGQGHGYVRATLPNATLHAATQLDTALLAATLIDQPAAPLTACR